MSLEGEAAVYITEYLFLPTRMRPVVRPNNTRTLGYGRYVELRTDNKCRHSAARSRAKITKQLANREISAI